MENNGYKGKVIENDDEKVDYTEKKQNREYGRSSITGRPNIEEISKRNAEAEKRERRSSYTVAGIIVLFIIVVIVLVYFFS